MKSEISNRAKVGVGQSARSQSSLAGAGVQVSTASSFVKATLNASIEPRTPTIPTTPTTPTTPSRPPTIPTPVGATPSGEIYVYRQILTGGKTTVLNGIIRTTFRFSSRLASHKFAIGQIRSTKPPYDELPRPQVCMVGVDEVLMHFWQMEPVPDGSVQVWFYRDPHDY